MDKYILSSKPDMSRLPGGWDPNGSKPWYVPLSYRDKCDSRKLYGEARLFKNLISAYDCNDIVKEFMKSPNFESVSVQGNKDVKDDRMGSRRTTVWAPYLAEELWEQQLKNVIMPPDHFTWFTDGKSNSETDWWQGDDNRKCWKPIGVSPMFRFMVYDKGGQHYPHYDAAYIYDNDNYRTLYSMVIYLTTVKNGGATRFIQDNQKGIPVWERNHSDWIREPSEDEVIAKVRPVKGNVLIFPHRMCHDVEKYLGMDDEKQRIIIRGDIVFKAQ